MGYGHIEEYKKTKTCSGWKETDKNLPWPVELMFKDVHGKASLQEQIVIAIDDLLKYNNIDFVSKEEIYEKSQEIINLTKK